jgi:D-inositol-3-phosphate glycosyltransferase
LLPHLLQKHQFEKIMKRIAMISYHTCPLASAEGKESGGMNVYVLELSRALARIGHQVDIFTRSVDTHNQQIVEIAQGLRLIHVKAGPQEVISKKELVPYIPEFIANYFEFTKSHNTVHDVLHAHYFLSGLIGLKLERLLQPVPPMVMSFHTLALMKNLVARDKSEKEDSSRVEAEMLLCREAQKIISPSESDKQFLNYLYDAQDSKVEIIPPGVDTTLFQPMEMNEAKKHLGVASDRKLIVYVGRIEPLKGIDVLMYAMKIVTRRNPEIPLSLCIVGGDISQPQSAWSSNLKSLDDLRNILHMTDIVHFAGQQKQPELPYYYNAAEMVVMPSHYESFGMSALEAMSCGVPVITTNVAGVSSLIDEKHASLIEHLLHNPEKRVTMSADVRNNVMDLSWGKIASQVSEVYETLC